MYFLSGRSIRVDTSPLFGTNTQPLVAREAVSPASRNSEATKTLSELFNDALDSANYTPQRPKQEKQRLSPSSPFRAAAPRQQTDHFSPAMGNMTPVSGTPNQLPRDVQYSEEMDWFPITPRHRAFAEQQSPIKGTGALAQGPLIENMSTNPFRYKVPAAPLNPAQRLRNPRRAPEPQKLPVDPDMALFTSQGRESGRSGERDGARDGVEFRQPQFFAPERDDASSLADLLSQSFSLSQEGDQDDEDAGGGEGGGMSQGARTGPQRAKAPVIGDANWVPTWNTRLLEPLVVAALLMAWVLTLVLPLAHRVESQVVVMAMSGVLALRGTGDAGAETHHGPVAAHVLTAWAVAELATICWVALTLWRAEAACVGWYGSGVLAMMLARLAWRNVA